MHAAWEGCLEPLDEALAQVLVESYLPLLRASPSMRTCKAPLTRRRKRQARTNVVGTEAWEIGQDLRLAHPSGQILQNIVDGDARAFDARLTAPHARCDRDTVFESPGTRLFKVPPRCKAHYLRSKRSGAPTNRWGRLELAGRTSGAQPRAKPAATPIAAQGRHPRAPQAPEARATATPGSAKAGNCDILRRARDTGLGLGMIPGPRDTPIP
jgi:hypothetical protein